MKGAAGLAVLMLLSTGNLVAGSSEAGTILTSRQPVLVAQQLLPGGSPPQDPAAIKVEKEDPLVERWKHDEVRRLDGGASETIIVERVMIAAACVVALLILGKLAFPG